jgi:hypothetical protein
MGRWVVRGKAPREVIVGSVREVDVMLSPRGQALVGLPVSLRLRTRAGERVVEDWFAVGKALKRRVRELAAVPDELVGHTFEFVLNESGEIVEMSRISM